MNARWRDKKNEPGFVFHAWMRTVDDLEDQIARLREALEPFSHLGGEIHNTELGEGFDCWIANDWVFASLRAIAETGVES